MAEKIGAQLTLDGGSVPVRVKVQPIGCLILLEAREDCFWPRGFKVERAKTYWTRQAGIHDIFEKNVTSHQGRGKITVVKVALLSKDTLPCAQVLDKTAKAFWGDNARQRAESFWNKHKAAKRETVSS